MKYELSIEKLDRINGVAELQVADASSLMREGEMTIDKQGIATLLAGGKGVISRAQISELTLALGVGGMLEVRVATTANELWNSQMKSRHPFRWAFGLITKSKGGIAELGAFRSRDDAAQLIDLIKALGWPVRELS